MQNDATPTTFGLLVNAMDQAQLPPQSCPFHARETKKDTLKELTNDNYARKRESVEQIKEARNEKTHRHVFGGRAAAKAGQIESQRVEGTGNELSSPRIRQTWPTMHKHNADRRLPDFVGQHMQRQAAWF